ncbi:hypothetical protein JNUCC1_00941 [Lentibacillus sp. JNUCC-1]|uniref:hypothetical protein n=1 Tax=Lentibacillus sp. JNUCC-1 TaxID=2654513 RepID=UPI0012E6FBF6|nr:hypothetical protein [Lentibacillus sp. JNUCC-1]MUV37135.1 hypothetical protein [Lentibacillus sp. JNUCC-1]
MITSDRYQINDFLESIANKSIFKLNGLSIKNEYPRLRQTIKKYKKKIEEAAKEPMDEIKDIMNSDSVIRVIDGNTQTFTQTIDLTNGDFYNITWSVTKAMEVVDTYDLPPMSFFVNVISDGIAPGAIESQRLKAVANSKDPIFIVSYPLLNTRTQMVVIDGNHRLMNKILSGEERINGYYLDNQYQDKALAGELDRTLYKVHYNLGAIINYMVGEINKSKLNKSLLRV